MLTETKFAVTVEYFRVADAIDTESLNARGMDGVRKTRIVLTKYYTSTSRGASVRNRYLTVQIGSVVNVFSAFQYLQKQNRSERVQRPGRCSTVHVDRYVVRVSTLGQ